MGVLSEAEMKFFNLGRDKLGTSSLWHPLAGHGSPKKVHGMVIKWIYRMQNGCENYCEQLGFQPIALFSSILPTHPHCLVGQPQVAQAF